MDENGNLVIYRKGSNPPMFTSAEQFEEAIHPAKEDPTVWSRQFKVDPIVKQPEVVPNNVNRNNVTIHYDNMINIQGDVNDADRIVNKMEAVAEKAIKKSWKDANMTLKYGIY